MMHLAAALLTLAPRAFTLVFGGDIMLNGVPVGGKPFDAIHSLVETGNAAFANLEIPLTDARTKTSAKSAEELKLRSQFILKADPRHLDNLRRSGFDLFSLGNNHAMDYGPKGLEQMLAGLRKECLTFAGAGLNERESMEVAVYTTRQGIRVGLVSALAFVGPKAIGKLSPAGATTPGVHALSFGGVLNKRAKARLASWIASARRRCDFVVVGLHWGTERKPTPTLWQVMLGRACIEAGADVVWGHHPHILQGAELYKGKPILYSMGNLVSALPSQTALARLYFAPDKLPKLRILPCSIARGKVVPLTAGACDSALTGFKLLSEQVQKLYPSKDSKPLY
jgi:poly-gamma-glutamate capsule biosynthesis protein CapA/YwtB (metallophosphatase superfamily)